MGNSILFDGHEAVANPPASLSVALAGSAWTVEGWVKLPLNYYHADDDLVIFSIGDKFSLYIECTTGDLKFSNGVTINSLSKDLIDGNRHYFVVTNDLTTSKVYINGYYEETYATTEVIANTDVINICDFVGRGDNFAFYDKALTKEQLLPHFFAGVCAFVEEPVFVYVYAGQVTALISTDYVHPNLQKEVTVYAGQVTAIIVEV